jgi:hypothetical protein
VQDSGVNKMNVGIDKIVLHTQDFKVKENNFRVRPAVVNYQTGEVENEFDLFRYQDDVVYGSGAFINTPRLNIDVNFKGMSVRFNPSKIYYGNNFHSINYQDNKEVLNQLDTEIKDCGVSLDFYNTDIARMDLQRTIPTEHNFNNYNPVFNFLHLKRTHTTDYGDGFSYRNKQREMIFYDKLKEMREHKVDLNTLGNLSKNVMRCEYRLRNKKSVRRGAEVRTLKQINDRDIFNHLSDVYKSRVTEELFSRIPENEETLNFDSEIEIAKYYRETYHRNATYKYIMSYVFDGSKSTTPDILKHILLGAGFNKSTVKRTLDDVYLSMQYSASLRDERRIKISKLGDELRRKLVA